MEIRTLGPLRVRMVEQRIPPLGSALTCVLLHGFGAPGDDLAGLLDDLRMPFPVRFVYPEALHALEDFIQPVSGDARAWWMVDFAQRERAIARGEMRDLTATIPEGLAEAREAVVAMLDELAQEAPGPLVLGGFSQGAMLSLDVALRDPKRPIAGLILLSGTMIAEKEWRPLMPGRSGMPVFQSHGESDPLLPFSVAERLRDAMAEAGLAVTFQRFGGGHTILPSTLRELGDWLDRVAVHP